MDDLPGLGVDRRVLGRRLQLRERVQRPDRDLGAEEERLQRGDQRVAPEHGHEPGHAGGEGGRLDSPVRMRSAARSSIERSNARRRLSHPPRTRGAERPRRDDVAERLALLGEALAALGVALAVERGVKLDVELPQLMRVEVEVEDHAAVLEPTRMREHHARPQVAALRLDQQLPRGLVVRRGRRRQVRRAFSGSPRAKSWSFR